jgi:hypothetical protein
MRRKTETWRGVKKVTNRGENGMQASFASEFLSNSHFIPLVKEKKVQCVSRNRQNFVIEDEIGTESALRREKKKRAQTTNE